MKSTRTRMLTGALVLAALMAAWGSMIVWNWHRIESTCGPKTPISSTDRSSASRDLWSPECDDLLMAADPVEYQFYFRGFPRSLGEVRGARQDAIFVEAYKRPLYGPISVIVNIFASTVLGLSYPATMYFALALYAGVSSLLVYCVMREVGAGPPMATLLAGIASLSSAWVTVFLMPESYSLTVAATLSAMLSGARLRRTPPERRSRALITHLGITVLASWIYLPIAGAVCFLLEDPRSRRNWCSLALAAVIVAGLALLPQLWLGGLEQIRGQASYGRNLSSLDHLASLEKWKNVGSAIAVFSFVFPGPDFLLSTGNVDWRAARSEPATLVGVAAVLVGYLILGAAATNSAGPRRHLAAPALWLAMVAVFHVVFNPDEILLYLSVPLTLIVYLSASVWVSAAGQWRRSAACALAVVLAVEVLGWVTLAMRQATGG